MHAESVVNAPDRRALRLARTTWWIVFPAFAALVTRISFERGCMNPFEVLAPAMRQQGTAVLVGLIYLGAHVWLVSVLLLMARARSSIDPWRATLSVVGGWQLLSMAGAIGVEQLPRALWPWVDGLVGLCR